MKKLYFAFGMLLGVLLTGGTGAAAAGLLAQPSMQAIYVDGERTYFTAYAIAGNNYVQLREVGRCVNFGVTYDAATDSVRISTGTPYAEPYAAAPVALPVDTSPEAYFETQTQPTISQQTAAQPAATAVKATDYSQDANPEVFTADLTREFYNSVRHAYLNAEKMAASYDRASHKTNEALAVRLPGDMSVTAKMKNVCSELGGVFYNYTISSGVPYVYACPRTDSDLEWPYVQEIIETAKQYHSDREKAEYLAETICDRLEYAYNGKIDSWNTAMENGGKAVCSGYATAFQRMGRAADLQVLTVGSAAGNHAWNHVYCDGEWLTVDLTHYDTSHNAENWFREKHPKMTPDSLDEINFAKEVMYPGSTT